MGLSTRLTIADSWGLFITRPPDTIFPQPCCSQPFSDLIFHRYICSDRTGYIFEEDAELMMKIVLVAVCCACVALSGCAKHKKIDEATKKAAAHYHKGNAEQGFAEDQFNLGLLYQSGFGVEKNEIEGYAWLMIAASNGYTEADLFLEELTDASMRARVAARADELRDHIRSNLATNKNLVPMWERTPPEFK